MWLTPDQQILRDLMSDISEEGWSAGWMYGLEHVLWHMVLNGPAKFGRVFVDEQRVQQLRSLAEQTDSWIIFDDTTEETAIPLDKWRKLYEGDNLAHYMYKP